MRPSSSIALPRVRRRDLLRSGIAAGAGLAAVDLFGASESSAQTVTMRLGSAGPLSGTQGYAYVRFKEEIESKSNGRIKVTIFPDAQLGGNDALNNAVKAGTLDGTVPDLPVMSSAVPEVDIFSLPFLFRDTPQALRAAQGAVGAKLKPKIEQAFRCELLGWGTQGSRNMWNSKHPIKTPDDVKGLKMRVQPSPIQKDTYAALGALPTPIAYTELYTALQTGVIDGADPGVLDMVDSKFYQVTKYLTLTEHYHIIVALIVSKQFMSKIGPEDQAIVREAGRVASEAQATNALNKVAAALKELQSRGIQVFQMDDPKAFVAKVEPIYAKDAEQVGGAAFVAEARNTV